jgi:hypothetical protein
MVTLEVPPGVGHFLQSEERPVFVEILWVPNMSSVGADRASAL